MTEPLVVTREGRTLIVAINRPERRNAVDLATARALHGAFLDFDADMEADVAILTGNGGAFCAGADLRALSEGERKPIELDGDFAHGANPPEAVQTRHRGHRRARCRPAAWNWRSGVTSAWRRVRRFSAFSIAGSVCRLSISVPSGCRA